MEVRQPRKLAVILHADVVGSTALVQRDESLAHERIQDAFHRFSRTIESYNGHPLELRGDALVAEFNRASDAVEASLAFQAENTRFNSTLEDAIQPTLRVGISLGEVVVADNTVTGEGIVLAQRLEQVASAGGVCIQGAVYEAVPGRLPFDYESLGEQALKGFSEPVRAYAVHLKSGETMPAPEVHAMPGESRPERAKRRRIVVAAMALLVMVGGGLAWFQPWLPREEPASIERMAFPLPDKPSIAVLAFENLTGDAAQEYLSDGISENIITALSRFREFFVVARQSAFSYKGKAVKVGQVSEELGVQYVLEGSLQQAGDKLRVTAQFIDATTGRHLWAEHYDRKLEDVLAVQDEITRTIAATVEQNVHLAEQERARSKPPQDLKAYEYVKLGRAHFPKYTKEGNERARQLFEKARELDPSYAEAYVGLTWVNVNSYRWGWSDTHSREESLRLAFKMAKKAVALDPFSHRAHWGLANALMQSGELQQALAEYDRALELNPNSASVLADAAEPLVYSGRAEEAVSRVKTAIRLNPYHPDWYLWQLGWAQYYAGEYEEALASLRLMTNLPNLARRTLAPVLVRLGRLEDARAVLAEFLKNAPDYTVEKYRLQFKGKFINPADEKRIIDDLRKAGLPENPSLALPDKPSIAVLPFTNMSGDPEQEYFADGMTDDLITDLSKISGLFVIARNSTFAYKGKSLDVREVASDLNVRYVLEGSVRRAGEQVRINAQLIDATTGGHLWAERYDAEMANLFALQDRITGKIVSALAVEFTTDQQQSEIKETDSIEAYDAYLQGWALYNRQTSKDFAKAIPFFEKAIELDPNYGRAYAALALTYFIGSERGLSRVLDEKSHVLRHRARKYLNRAMHQPTSIAHVVASLMSLKQRLWGDAVAHASRAVALEPSNANAHSRLAYVLNYAGDPEGAIEAANQAMRLDPVNPSLPLQWIGRAQFSLGNFEESLKWLDRARKHNPTVYPAALVYASASAHLGREAQAKAALAQYNKAWPLPPPLKKIMYYWPFKDPVVAERFTQGILKAGQPDSSGTYYRVSEQGRLDAEAIESLLAGYTVTGLGPWDGKQWKREYGSDGTVRWYGPPVEKPTWHGPDVDSDTGTFTVKEDLLCEEWKAMNEGDEVCFPVFHNPEGTLKQQDEYLFITDRGIYAWSRMD